MPSFCCQLRKAVTGALFLSSLTLLTLLPTSALVGAAPTTPVPPEFFEMTFYPGKVPADFVGTVGALGKTPMTSWPYVQPKSRTEFDWSGIDHQVADMKTLGLKHFVYFVGYVPGWAVANHAPKTGSVHPITKQWTSLLPPDDMTDFTNFLHEFLTRYPQVELIYTYCEPQNAPVPVTSAIAMDRALIDYVHKNFPGVRVGSPTVQPRGTDEQSLRPGYWYFDYWNQGGPKDFDVLLWHGYPGLKVVTPSANTVEVVAQRRDHLQALINNFGLQAKPVVDEESSWEFDKVAQNNKTDTVAFVSQDLLMHWSFGDQQFCWYGGAGLACGTLGSGPGGPLNSAGVSWNMTRSWMLGSTLTGQGIGLDGVVRSGVWTRPGGYRAISAWTADGSSTVFTVPTNNPPYVQYRDTAGSVTPLTNGQVTLSGRPIWIETKGGASAPVAPVVHTEGKIEAKLLFSVDGGKTYTETSPVVAAPQVVYVQAEWQIIDEERGPIKDGVVLNSVRSEESDFGSANAGSSGSNGKTTWSQRIPTYWCSATNPAPVVYPVDLGARPEGVAGVKGPLPAASALAPGVHKFVFRLYYHILDTVVETDMPFQVTIGS